ncbi:MAG: PASTA domain-containing protein [Armatimonadota bacterium]
MTKRGLGRDEDHRVAWEESYPHPLISCMMPGIAVLAVIAAMLFGFHFWQGTLPEDTSVPMLAGVRQEEALNELKQAGLNAELLKERVPSEEIPEGYVISTSPVGGRHVKMGRLVRLVISSGSAYTKVPDVRELSQTAARERLQSAYLLIAEEEYAYHPSIPFDRVISVAPKQGMRVEKLSTVKLVISKGPEETRHTETQRNGVKVLKTTTLTVNIPTDGEPRDNVRIDVTDKNGTRTVFQKEFAAGDTVVQSVEGTGEVTAKVYYGNRLVLTRTF